MKRDRTGRFAQAWYGEPKQAVKLSLTSTAWQLLEQQSQEIGISRSELVERYARSSQCCCAGSGSAQTAVVPDGRPSVALLVEQTATLRQHNAELQDQILELQQRVKALRSQEPGQDASVQTNERQWLEAVLNMLPTPLILVDPAQLRVTFSNQAANAIAGVDLANDVGATYNADYHCTDATGQMIPPEQVPAVRAARGEKISGTEINWHTPVGVFPLLVHADVLPAMYNHSPTSVVVFQDIGERKQIEEQLKESQHFIQQVADATPGMLYIYDLDEQRHVYANRQIGEVLGYTAEAVQAMGSALLATLMHPEDFSTLLEYTEHFDHAQDGEVIEREYRMRHANGEWRWLWSRDLVFSRTQTGAARQVLGIAHDITDRKQAELVTVQLHQAEQAARINAEMNEQRFRCLAESIPQMVWVAQADGFTEYYNQRWLQYTGLTLEESQNANGSFRHPDDCDRFGQAWVNAATRKETFQAEQRIRRADGAYRWHLTRAFPLLDQNGEILKWFGSCTDIDDWKRMEQTQRFLAQASQTFVAASLDLQTILDTVTRLSSELAGDVCVLNLLTTDEQLLDHASFYHSDPEIRAFVGDWLERYPRRIDEGIGGRIMQTGEPLLMSVKSPEEFSAMIKLNYRLYLERFPISSTLIVPLKAQGRSIGVLSLIRHASADPHTQDDLNLFQDLADRAAMAIANARLYQQAEQARLRAERIADRTARLQAVTAALSESLTPVQVAEVIAQHAIAVVAAASVLVALITPQKDELEIIHYLGNETDVSSEWRRFPLTIATPLTDAIRTGQPVWEETLEERINRYPHLKATYAQAKYPAWISLPLMVEGQAVGGMTVTFTQLPQLEADDRSLILSLAQQCAQAIARAQLYEAEQQARTQAEAANRTKDEFLAMLSHELRTPMNPILGWARLLHKGNLDANRTAIALETIERNARLQVQLIEDLLDISRILQGKLSLNPCLVNLPIVIDAALETVRLAAEAKNIQIQTKFVPPISHVLGDASRLQQVIWNLLSNAVKFTPEGGQIDVRLEEIENEKWNSVKSCSPSTPHVLGYAQIIVTDTGKGISPQFLPFVFDTFRQADSSITRRFGGLGLGLAIAHHIVELHGGTIQVESAGEGQGATFIVKLPLMSTSTVSIQEPTLVNKMPTLQGVTVLAVDDEIDNLELATFILEETGASVVALSSASEALQVLAQAQPDILLLDIGMPQIDGYTLLRQIRTMETEQGDRQVPAIALTAYAGEVDQQQALAAGFQQHLSKPVEPEVLLQAILRLLSP